MQLITTITNLLLSPATGGERSEGATGMGAMPATARDLQRHPHPAPAQPLWLFPHIAGEGGTIGDDHAITRISSKQTEAVH